MRAKTIDTCFLDYRSQVQSNLFSNAKKELNLIIQLKSYNLYSTQFLISEQSMNKSCCIVYS